MNRKSYKKGDFMNIFETLKNQKPKTYKCLSCGKVFEFQVSPFLKYTIPPKPTCTNCVSFCVVRWFNEDEGYFFRNSEEN